MRLLRKILPGILILGVLYGALLLFERLATQELTRATQATTQDAVCLVWRPRLLKGDGLCSLDLLNSQGKIVDTASLGTPETGFEALQQFGQLDFQGKEVTVANRRTSEVIRRFVVHDSHLEPN